MIPQEMFHFGLKALVATASGIGGLMFATADLADEKIFGVSVNVIRELGSFGLVALFVIGVIWAIWKTVPTIIAMLERTKDQFVEEIKQEREAREKSVEAFREMLQSHKGDLGGKMNDIKDAIEKGNELTNKLVSELSSRPCQKQ